MDVMKDKETRTWLRIGKLGRDEEYRILDVEGQRNMDVMKDRETREKRKIDMKKDSEAWT